MRLKITTFCFSAFDGLLPLDATSSLGNTTTAPAQTSATIAGPTESTDPPSASEGSLGLSFRLTRTFTSDLTNSTSAAFQTLAAEVTTEVRFPFTKTEIFLSTD